MQKEDSGVPQGVTGGDREFQYGQGFLEPVVCAFSSLVIYIHYCIEFSSCIYSNDTVNE